MKKKIRSRIGLTLVELVVTIAILGMIAGMGVGMVGSAIRNYHTASVTSKEQDTALAVESFILNSIRTSASVKSVSTSSSFPPSDVSAFYLYFDNGKLKTMRHEVEKVGVPPTVTTISYDDVASMKFSVRKQKSELVHTENSNNFVYLYYEITMKEGYMLKGSAIINNASAEYETIQNDYSFVELDPNVNVEIKSDSTDHTAFAIMKQ